MYVRFLSCVSYVVRSFCMYLFLYAFLSLCMYLFVRSLCSSFVMSVFRWFARWFFLSLGHYPCMYLFSPPPPVFLYEVSKFLRYVFSYVWLDFLTSLFMSAFLYVAMYLCLSNCLYFFSCKLCMSLFLCGFL